MDIAHGINAVAGGTIARYQIVVVDGTTENSVIAASSIGEDIVGVAQEAVTVGQHVRVATHGETYVLAGEAIAANAILKTDAAGKASDAAIGVGDQVIGYAVEAASAVNAEIKMQLNVSVSHARDV